MDYDPLKTFLSKFPAVKLSGESDVSILEINKYDFVETMPALKFLAQFDRLVDITYVTIKNKNFLIYHLYNNESAMKIQIRSELFQGEKIPSISKVWENAHLLESEVSELYGIGFIRRDPVRNFLSPLCEGHPYNSSKFRYFKRVEENTVQAESQLSQYHQGIEKFLEDHPVVDHYSVLQSLDNASPEWHLFAYARALEELWKIKMPKKAQVLRMIIFELARIESHLVYLYQVFGHFKHDFVAKELLALKFEIRKTLLALMPDLHQYKMAGVIGGFPNDVPLGWVNTTRETLTSLEGELARINKVFECEAKFINKFSDDFLTARRALDWGVTGPNLRATGLNYDLRKHRPYYLYEDVEFEIVLGNEGSALDRYFVRMEECFQSILIVEQLLGSIPAGKFHLADQISKSHTYDLFTGEKPNEFFPISLESPTGELSWLMLAGEGWQCTRYHLISPSYSQYQAISDMALECPKSKIKDLILNTQVNLNEVSR